MPRNGSGLYILPDGNPVVYGDAITETWANTTLSDISEEITKSLAVDGQAVPNANLPMAGYRHTGCGDGVANTDYATVGQVPKIARPLVSVYSSSAQNIPSMSGTTNTKVTLFSQTEKNSNTWWSVANQKFTPTIAGWYLIDFCVHCFFNPTVVSYARAFGSIYKNGSPFKRGQDGDISSEDYFTLTGSSMIYLNGSSDYLELYITCVAPEVKTDEIVIGKVTSDSEATYFQAVLLGAD